MSDGNSDAAIRVSKVMQPLASELQSVLSEVAGEPTIFCLVVFTPVRLNYVSNCSREDVKKCLQELLDGWAAGMPDVPAHKVI
jgi:hypothetical protein